MVLGIPVVTQEWLHACLENQEWVDVSPFLHPRFDRFHNHHSKGKSNTNSKQNSKRKTQEEESLGIYLAIGESSNPSIEIVRGLVENWNLTHLVTNPDEADFIVVGKYFNFFLTIY